MKKFFKNRFVWFIIGSIVGGTLTFATPPIYQRFSYYDIVNGRREYGARIFGFPYVHNIDDTFFTVLVKKYRMEGSPEFMDVCPAGSYDFMRNYFGTCSNYCAMNSNLFDLDGYLRARPNDNSTTIILTSRRLLRNKNLPLLPLLKELMPDDKRFKLALDDQDSTGPVGMI